MTPLKSESLHTETSTSAKGARILKLNGQLTLQTLFDFQQTAREDATKPVILDLSNIAYMDSAGLGSLLGMFASCQRTGRGFAVVNLPDRVRTLFQVTHVDQLLPTFDTVEQAEASFK